MTCKCILVAENVARAVVWKDKAIALQSNVKLDGAKQGHRIRVADVRAANRERRGEGERNGTQRKRGQGEALLLSLIHI